MVNELSTVIRINQLDESEYRNVEEEQKSKTDMSYSSLRLLFSITHAHISMRVGEMTFSSLVSSSVCPAVMQVGLMTFPKVMAVTMKHVKQLPVLKHPSANLTAI